MADFLVYNHMTVKSSTGVYSVALYDDPWDFQLTQDPSSTHCIIDRNLLRHNNDTLSQISDAFPTLWVDANEKSKSLETLPTYVDSLIRNGIRRDHILVAIGGGITQDITAFLASTILRGIDWIFYPTNFD